MPCLATSVLTFNISSFVPFPGAVLRCPTASDRLVRRKARLAPQTMRDKMMASLLDSASLRLSFASLHI
nr:hypothetical protein CFP56_01443 [Quercus suber]